MRPRTRTRAAVVAAPAIALVVLAAPHPNVDATVSRTPSITRDGVDGSIETASPDANEDSARSADRSSQAVASSASTAPSDPIIYENCRERFFVGLGVYDEVRRRVPLQYELLVDPATGRPLLRVAAQYCEAVTVPGLPPRPMNTTFMNAFLESPDGGGCVSRTPAVGDLKGDAVPLCNFYGIFWAVDNPAVLDWARDGAPDLAVVYVEDLTFKQAEFDSARLGAPFHFEAGAPTPSPFTLDAVVRERPIESPITVAFWRDASVGAVKLTFASDDLAFGEADATLHADPGSEMAEMFGSATPAPAPGSSMIGAVSWRHGELRKEVTRPGFAQGCHERLFIGSGDPALVDDAVPDRYELVRDASNRPLLFLGAIRCERAWIAGGAPRPVTIVVFEALIESPDGAGCGSSTPVVQDVKGDAVPLCNWYVLWRAYDDREFVEWYRDGAPDFPAYYVEDLSFEQGELDPAALGAPFHFEAGSPTPSSFDMDAVVRERPMEHPLAGSWWWDDGTGGTVKITFESDNFAFGDADIALHVGPGSEMAQMFGSETPEPAPGNAQLGGIHWGLAEVRIEIRNP